MSVEFDPNAAAPANQPMDPALEASRHPERNPAHDEITGAADVPTPAEEAMQDPALAAANDPHPPPPPPDSAESASIVDKTV